MEIYILRHAIAVTRGKKDYPNDDRPLTKQGVQKMKLEVGGIARIVKQVDVILTSPLIRANDTAKILAKGLGKKTKIETSEELLPGVPVKKVLSSLEKFKDKKSVLLVGHEPELGFIASALLGSEKPMIQFKKGSLCRIDVAGLPLSDPGQLVWHLSPKQLRALA